MGPVDLGDSSPQIRAPGLELGHTDKTRSPGRSGETGWSFISGMGPLTLSSGAGFFGIMLLFNG
jgi:hypothetical protein